MTCQCDDWVVIGVQPCGLCLVLDGGGSLDVSLTALGASSGAGCVGPKRGKDGLGW